MSAKISKPKSIRNLELLSPEGSVVAVWRDKKKDDTYFVAVTTKSRGWSEFTQRAHLEGTYTLEGVLNRLNNIGKRAEHALDHITSTLAQEQTVLDEDARVNHIVVAGDNTALDNTAVVEEESEAQREENPLAALGALASLGTVLAVPAASPSASAVPAVTAASPAASDGKSEALINDPMFEIFVQRATARSCERNQQLVTEVEAEIAELMGKLDENMSEINAQDRTDARAKIERNLRRKQVMIAAMSSVIG